MGRRGKRNQYKNNNSDESDIESDCDEPVKPLWSIVVQNTDDLLIDLKFDYDDNDLRFKWLGVADVRRFVNEVLFNKQIYKNFSYEKGVYIDYYIHRFVTDVIDIMDLQTMPIISDRYGTLVDPDVGVATPIKINNKVMVYLNKRILNHFDGYGV